MPKSKKSIEESVIYHLFDMFKEDFMRNPNITYKNQTDIAERFHQYCLKKDIPVVKSQSSISRALQLDKEPCILIEENEANGVDVGKYQIYKDTAEQCYKFKLYYSDENRIKRELEDFDAKDIFEKNTYCKISEYVYRFKLIGGKGFNTNYTKAKRSLQKIYPEDIFLKFKATPQNMN